MKMPLYRDPIYDGAADPVVIWNREAKERSRGWTSNEAEIRSGRLKSFGMMGCAICMSLMSTSYRKMDGQGSIYKPRPYSLEVPVHAWN